MTAPGGGSWAQGVGRRRRGPARAGGQGEVGFGGGGGGPHRRAHQGGIAAGAAQGRSHGGGGEDSAGGRVKVWTSDVANGVAGVDGR